MPATAKKRVRKTSLDQASPVSEADGTRIDKDGRLRRLRSRAATKISPESLSRDRRIADYLETADARSAVEEMGLLGWAECLASLESAEALGYTEALPAARRGGASAQVRDGRGRERRYDFDPSLPTKALPGSPEKLAVLRARRRRGLPLFLRGDA